MNLEELTALLDPDQHKDLSPYQRFERICDWLHAAYAKAPEATVRDALPQALAQLSSWPDEDREGWSDFFLSPDPHPLAALYRSITWEGYETPQEMERFFVSPNLGSIKQLYFCGLSEREPFGARMLPALCRSPHLDQLRSLTLFATQLTDEDIARLARCKALSSLEHLALPDNYLTDEAARALANAPHLKRLSSMSLDGCYKISAAGLSALKASLPNLEVLEDPDWTMRQNTAAALTKHGGNGVSPPTAGETDLERVEAALEYIRRDSSEWRCQADLPAAHECMVTWSQDAWARAFDAQGALIAPLSMRFQSAEYFGGWAKVQTAFAFYGLSPQVQEDRLELAPEGTRRTTDLIRLCHAFAALQRAAFFAYPCHRMMTSYGWEDANEACHISGGETALRAVFWNYQGHCFDPIGALKGDLAIQWAGDRERIAEALQEQGLRFEVPENEDRTFVVTPHHR